MNTAERKLRNAGVWLEADDLRAPDFALLALVGDTRAIEVRPDKGDPDCAGYLIGRWFSPVPSRPLHSTRCVATAKATGRRCRRWSVIGFERCYVHSGFGRLRNSVQYRQGVLDRARGRLLGDSSEVIPIAVDRLTDPHATPAQRLAACVAVLDVVGITPPSETQLRPPAKSRRRTVD